MDKKISGVRLHVAQYVTKFLMRSTDKGTAVITGKRVNSKAGYGLEIPCKLYLLWRHKYFGKMAQRKKIEKTGLFKD